MLKKVIMVFFQYFLFLFILFNIPFNPVLAMEDAPSLFLKINNEQKIAVPKEEFTSWTSTNYYLKYDSDYRSQIENISYCYADKIFCNLLKTTRQSYSTKKINILTIKNKKIITFLKNIDKRFGRSPIEATLTVDKNGKVSAFSLGQEGLKINIKKSSQSIINFLSKNKKTLNGSVLSLTVDKISPVVESSNLDKFGIKSLLGEGISNFKGSTKSRIHNIEVASNKFNGILIKPGEEFSFVETLGKVDGEHGYKPELVIKNNLTTPEFGGGICQVSTTAFRAAIYSGLKITARKNHAYPVHYYNPQGFDATVYIPKPDLRFVNNTQGYILIQTNIDLEKTELTFRFYGTDDGRKIEIDGPRIISRGANGAMKTIFTQKVIDKNGNTIIDDSFKSNYASPNNYPHPGQTTTFTKKPKNWSKNQWKKYKKEHNL